MEDQFEKITLNVDATIGDIVKFITDKEDTLFVVIGYLVFDKSLKYLIKNGDMTFEAFSFEIEKQYRKPV